MSSSQNDIQPPGNDDAKDLLVLCFFHLDLVHIDRFDVDHFDADHADVDHVNVDHIDVDYVDVVHVDHVLVQGGQRLRDRLPIIALH